MSGYVLHDLQFQLAMENCSPQIKAFLGRLDAGDKLVQWDLLERAGLKKNGYFFGVTDGLRSMSEQLANYQKGREVDYTATRSGYNAKFPFRGVKYVLNSSTVTDSSRVVTEVFAGKSLHNYGLAVDVRFDALGWRTGDIDFLGVKTGLKDVYRQSGLPLLAAACGLKWGGDWQDLFDPYHFEDRSYFIPDGYDYNYDENCNFSFIEKYNNGTLFSADDTKAKEGKFSVASVVRLLGVVSALAVGVLIGKKFFS